MEKPLISKSCKMLRGGMLGIKVKTELDLVKVIR